MASLTSVDPSNVLDQISAIIEEDLSGAVPLAAPPLDSFYKELKTTAMGVTSEGFGRDFKIIHPFRLGVGGTIKWVSSPLGSAGVQGLNQPVARTAAQVDSYPGLAENVAPGHVSSTITLARAKGNIFAPVEYAKADLLSASLRSSLAELIRSSAENIALADIHQFYRITSSDAQGIATVGTDAPTEANENATLDRLTFVVASGSIRNFYPGMLIDFHAVSGGAVRTYSAPIIVDKVRYLPDTTNDTGGWGQISVVSTGGDNLGTSTSGIVPGDMITRLDSEGNGPLGPEDWLKTSGTVFGIALGTYQQFQSIVQAVSGVLTGPVLNKFTGRFLQAYGMQNLPDSVITSIGVTNAHVEQSEGLSIIDRTNAPYMISEGFDFGDVPFRFLGRKFKWHTSGFMPSSSSITAATQTGGRLWMLKTRDRNLMRYVPPARSGAGGSDPIPNEIEFMMPSGGPMGIFKARHDGSGDTVNVWEAPFDKWIAIAPRFMPGIVLTGLTESI